MYIIVSPFSKTFDERGLTYGVPDFLLGKIKIGNIVEFPLKEKREIGIVLSLEENTDIEVSKIKLLFSLKNEKIFLQKYQETLLPWIASNYFTPIHNSVNLFLPKNLREKIMKDTINKQTEKDSFDPHYSYDHTISLSGKQEEIYKKISGSVQKKILLYGVTGSGKTEVYIKLIQDMLQSGKQSLFLIPEIILTSQISERIQNVFGDDVVTIHSGVSDALKTKHRIRIYDGKAKIVVGTRSALFYPFKNLGLIIIDEEHDSSYISDSGARYDTREVAEKITNLNQNMLILGSGTPSVKSLYKGIKGKYEILHLLDKYNH